MTILLLCFAGRNGWMLMLVLRKGIKGWSFGPGDSHRFNINGSIQITLRTQIIWWPHCSRTGPCHHLKQEPVVKPQHMDSRIHHSWKGWGKAGFKPCQKICLSPARAACVLESMEDRRWETKMVRPRGFCSVPYIPI